jgi:hypothetical protein
MIHSGEHVEKQDWSRLPSLRIDPYSIDCEIGVGRRSMSVEDIVLLLRNESADTHRSASVKIDEKSPRKTP